MIYWVQTYHGVTAKKDQKLFYTQKNEKERKIYDTTSTHFSNTAQDRLYTIIKLFLWLVAIKVGKVANK